MSSSKQAHATQPPPVLPAGAREQDEATCLHALGEHFAAGFVETRGAPPIIRWSRAVRRRWENEAIGPAESWVLAPSGTKRPDPKQNRLPAPSYSFTWTFDRRRAERFAESATTDTTKSAIQRLCAEMEELEALTYVPPPDRHHVGGWGYTHSIPNYRRLVREGFEGFERRIAARREHAIAQRDGRARTFCDAMADVLAGFRRYVVRLRAAAAAAALRVEDAAARADLERIRRALEHVPERPARTFFEALLVWNLVYYFDDCDNPGRIDQELVDFLERDLAAGRITRDQAQRLVDAFADNVNINWGWSAAIGGTARDGSDGCNLLTELCLRAARNRARPSWELRIRPDTPDRIWELALDALASGSGNPALYNDRLMIESLLESGLGLTPEDAAMWNGGGCTETMIHGCSNVGSLDAGLNLLQILEQTLKAELLRVHSFDEFMTAFKADVRDAIARVTEAVSRIQQRRARHRPQPTRSFFIDDCIDRACEFCAGGARYNWSVVNIAGLANVYDSLAALRTVVFEEKSVSATVLLQALEQNFEGFEPLRQRLLHCPRFGNDDPRADEIAAEFARFVFEEFRKHRPWRGGRFLPSIIMFETFAGAGAHIGATPDGRRAGEPLADSVGPAAGRDRRGPTAMLRSVTRLPLRLACGTPVLNLRLAPSLFRSPDGRRSVRRLIETYFELGGLQVQITVADRRVLEDALEHPERHENLIVRIGGYSTYFNRLSPALKQAVIQRTEYAD